MASYLITGIAGFIGSSLARELLLRGEQVRGVDNFSTGKRENLAEILGRIDFHEADLLDLDAMKQACAGVDYVLHQAAIPSVPKSVLDPIASNRANVDGTVNVLVASIPDRAEEGQVLPIPDARHKDVQQVPCWHFLREIALQRNSDSGIPFAVTRESTGSPALLTVNSPF